MQSKRLKRNNALTHTETHTHTQKKTAYDWVKGILSTHSDKPPHIIAALASGCSLVQASVCGRMAWGWEKSPLCLVFSFPFLHWEVGRGQPSCSLCHWPRRRHTLDAIQLQADLTVAARHGCRQQHVDTGHTFCRATTETCVFGLSEVGLASPNHLGFTWFSFFPGGEAVPPLVFTTLNVKPFKVAVRIFFFFATRERSWVPFV